MTSRHFNFIARWIRPEPTWIHGTLTIMALSATTIKIRVVQDGHLDGKFI